MMSDPAFQKTDVRYTITGEHNGKTITIYLTVHLDNQERRVSIRGTNGKFNFTESDPYLIGVINELIEKALDIARDEPRNTSEKES